MLLEFGSVDCTEDNLFESVCHYECQVGYHIFDSEFINEEFVTSECLEDGEWNRVLPICEKNTCPHDDEDFGEHKKLGMHNDESCTCSCHTFHDGLTASGMVALLASLYDVSDCLLYRHIYKMHLFVYYKSACLLTIGGKVKTGEWVS